MSSTHPIQISMNLSHALVDLVQKGVVPLDAIEVVDKVPVERIRQAQAQLPGFPFHLHAGRAGLEWFLQKKLARHLEVCPQTPVISVHLVPLPFAITWLAMKAKVYLPQPPTQMLVRNYIKKVKRLKASQSLPVILENIAVLHPKKYLMETNPMVINRILEETGCDLLLDLSHARIAAQVLGMAVEDYVNLLPLEKVVQVHVSGVRERDGRLYDAHQSLQEEDYALLEWALTKVRPAWLTLEYFREDRDEIRQQLTRLKAIISAI